MPTRPLLVGRGPWAQKILAALPDSVHPSICGHETAMDAIRHAGKRGNDSVIIASSAPSHYELLMAALKERLPVFIEKPFVMSVKEATAAGVLVSAMDIVGDVPRVVCDYTHLWTEGFENAWRRRSVLLGTPTPIFRATFGGPGPKRSDVHPVWDYGSHPIAMATVLGIDLTGAKLIEQHGAHCWILSNSHAEIVINTDMQQKEVRVEMEGVFNYLNGTWNFPDREPIYNQRNPPLQRVLKSFFIEARSAEPPIREGIGLPRFVTHVLESVCSSKSPYESENAGVK